METKNIDYTDDKLIAVLHNDNSNFLTVEKDGKLMEVDLGKFICMDAEEILSFLERDLKTLVLTQKDDPRFVNDYAMARTIITLKETLTSATLLLKHVVGVMEEYRKYKPENQDDDIQDYDKEDPKL